MIKVSEKLPINKLHPIIQKQLLDQLKRFNNEEHLLALILYHMINQLDEVSLKSKEIQKVLIILSKLLRATRYVSSLVETSNKIWVETFEERTQNVSIIGFCSALIYRKEKQFRKMGINVKRFQKMNLIHGTKKHGMVTFSTVTLMLNKLESEVKKIDEEESEMKKILRG